MTSPTWNAASQRSGGQSTTACRVSAAPSQRQRDARIRNWGIRNLRSLYAVAGQLSPERADAVRTIIDAELTARGAEAEGARKARMYKESA